MNGSGAYQIEIPDKNPVARKRIDGAASTISSVDRRNMKEILALFSLFVCSCDVRLQSECIASVSRTERPFINVGGCATEAACRHLVGGINFDSGRIQLDSGRAKIDAAQSFISGFNSNLFQSIALFMLYRRSFEFNSIG
jgi:hypothetical protein